MIKFGVAIVRESLDLVPMTRLKVDEGSTALHVVADALSCTSVEAEEQISRLEAFTSFAGTGEGKTALSLNDLQDPISSFKFDGFKAIKAYPWPISPPTLQPAPKVTFALLPAQLSAHSHTICEPVSLAVKADQTVPGAEADRKAEHRPGSWQIKPSLVRRQITSLRLSPVNQVYPV